ncbi:MAG: UPF0223 family protein [Limosilactobacillus sp.]|uniref:UPF0223 family protein n=1 Tax=Limosilactobacillus sp. TaxID=2773925 RepID=UPI0027064222|nr:UPF0223 family protein [Limosilactobacillus sp.]
MKEKSYSYPLNPDWTPDEMVTVINFFNAVEDAYETGCDRDKFMDNYRKFQNVVGSKMGEKQLGREFKDVSGYDYYQVVKLAQSSSQKKLKMVGD